MQSLDALLRVFQQAPQALGGLLSGAGASAPSPAPAPGWNSPGLSPLMTPDVNEYQTGAQPAAAPAAPPRAAPPSVTGFDFAGYEQQYGLPEGYLGRTAYIESRGNPRAQNPNSSAAGLFQFIDSTAAQYGLSDPFDPTASADAAARLARDNAAQLRRALGREPTAAELYLAHQQGGGGASALLSNPNAKAADIVGLDAVRLNGGRPDMTAGEFASLWISKYEASGGADVPVGSGGSLSSASTGAPPMQGLLSMPPAPERSPSIFDRFEGRGGLLGAIGDPERRQRLAMGLMSLSKAPPQAAMEMVREDMKDGRQTQRIAQVAEWLAQQPGGQDYAAALAAGLGEDEVLGAFMASRQPQAGPAPTDDMREYEFARQQGFEGSFAEWQGNGATAAPTTDDITEYEYYRRQSEEAGQPPLPFNEWTMAQREAGATNVTTTVGGDGFTDTTNKLLAESAMATVAQGAAAQRSMGELMTLETALGEAPQGMAGNITSLASSLGLPVEGASEVQIAEAMISRLVPSQRQPGTGPMSDADLALYRASLPRIANQPGGNQLIISTLKNIAQYDMSRAQIAERLVLGEITPAQAFEEYRALPHPIPPELLAGASAPQPVTGVGGTTAPPRVGVWNPETGQVEWSE